MRRRQPPATSLSRVARGSSTPCGQSAAQWSDLQLTPEQREQLRQAIGNPVVISSEVE